MQPTPVLSREEYIEQAYFFRACRQRLEAGWPTQQTLEHLTNELLSTTRLPLAVQFLVAEIKHAGQIGDAMRKLPHYFTKFQSHVISQSEIDKSKFTFSQALLILGREAEYKSGEPTQTGLFIYQLETLTRNQLGYIDGLISMESDGFYDDIWRRYITFFRSQIGVLDVAEMIYLQSEHAAAERRQIEPDYEPKTKPLFGEKEGRIAAANKGRDPNYLFSALQRQLGFPEVPRPPRNSEQKQELEELKRKVKALEHKLKILEGEVHGQTDQSLFVSRESRPKPQPDGE